MNESLSGSSIGKMPGANLTPSAAQLRDIEHMRQAMAVGQSFVDPASVAAPIPDVVAKKYPEYTPIIWRLVSGNMSPEAQAIEYDKLVRDAVATGKDVSKIDYPIGKNARTSDQAKSIEAMYEIIQQPNDPTGFSGTLLRQFPASLKEGETRELLVALRDTEFRPNELGGNANQDVSGADQSRATCSCAGSTSAPSPRPAATTAQATTNATCAQLERRFDSRAA